MVASIWQTGAAVSTPVFGDTVDTLAELRPLSKLSYAQAILLGHSSKGDGGGGIYWYDSSDTSSADNNGSIVVANDGGRWKLQDPGFLDVKKFGAKGDGTTDDTAAFHFALAVGKQVYVPPGTYRVNLTLSAGHKLVGAGVGVSVLKSKTSSTANTITASGGNISVQGLTIDGSAATSNGGVFFSGCSYLYASDLYITGAKGIGLWVYNSPYFRISNIHNNASVDWGILLDGATSIGWVANNLINTNCTNRGVMVRGVGRGTISNVTGENNGATCLWVADSSYVTGSNFSDYNDTVGDAVAIDGACIGVVLSNVTAKLCGGHSASINSNGSGGPVNCQIIGVYSDQAGECIAAISDQGTGTKPVSCSIDNVYGQNCGRVTPSEGFALVNTTNCRISGTIYNTAGTMTYAVKESGAGPSGSVFDIMDWVSGTSGYFSISSPSSVIKHSKRDLGFTRVGDADLTWNPATHNATILVDQAALTAARTITLGLGWPNQRVRVTRMVGGAFNLLVKQGGTTIKTIAATNLWEDFIFDGSNWNPYGGGTV